MTFGAVLPRAVFLVELLAFVGVLVPCKVNAQTWISAPKRRETSTFLTTTAATQARVQSRLETVQKAISGLQRWGVDMDARRALTSELSRAPRPEFGRLGYVKVAIATSMLTGESILRGVYAMPLAHNLPDAILGDRSVTAGLLDEHAWETETFFYQYDSLGQVVGLIEGRDARDATLGAIDDYLCLVNPDNASSMEAFSRFYAESVAKRLDAAAPGARDPIAYSLRKAAERAALEARASQARQIAERERTTRRDVENAAARRLAERQRIERPVYERPEPGQKATAARQPPTLQAPTSSPKPKPTSSETKKPATLPKVIKIIQG